MKEDGEMIVALREENRRLRSVLLDDTFCGCIVCNHHKHMIKEVISTTSPAQS